MGTRMGKWHEAGMSCDGNGMSCERFRKSLSAWDTAHTGHSKSVIPSRPHLTQANTFQRSLAEGTVAGKESNLLALISL